MTAIRVLSGGAAQGLIEEVRSAFESSTGRTIEGTFGAVGAMKARLLGGEPADLVILTRALIDGLAKDGHAVACSVADLGTVDTAVAIRQGDAVPAIADKAALRSAMLAASAIHFPDPEQATAGIHFAKVLRELGIWNEVEARLRTAPNGATAMRALAASTEPRPIGCTQATEILVTSGIVLVAPLPRGCELATVYAAAVATNAQSTSAARQLIAMLTDSAMLDTRRRLGFA